LDGRIGAGEPEIFVLGQNPLEFRLVFLDGLHGFLDGPGDVLVFGQLEEVIVAGMVGQIKSALFYGDIGNRLFPPSALEFGVLRKDRFFTLG